MIIVWNVKMLVQNVLFVNLEKLMINVLVVRT